MKILDGPQGSCAGSERRGGVLVLALIAVLAVTMMTGGFLQISSSMGRRQRQASETKQAIYLAEAGLAEAYLGLGVAKTGNVGTPDAPATFAGGVFWVEAAELANDRVQLESTALWGSGRATLGLVVERVELNAGTLGVFSNDSVTLGQGSYVDSYDSSAGTYPDQLAAGANNDEATLGSNGPITLNGGGLGIEVRGDVTPGVGEGLTQTGSVTVSGSGAPRGAPMPLPPVDPPAIPLAPGITHTSAVPLVLDPGEMGYQSIQVGANSEIIVLGPATVVVGDLLLDSDATFQFDVTGGPIDVYVTQSMALQPGSSLTNTAEDPTQLTVQVLAPTPGANNVTLDSSSQFYGTVYAPDSEVVVASGYEIFGAIVADSLTLGPGVQLHLDLAFAALESSLPSLLAWRVVDIPTGLAAKGGDPFHTLGLDPATLPTPAEAHEDQRLILDYVDAGGIARHFDGWESDFDWSDVSEIVHGTRDGTDFRPVETADADDGGTTAPPAPPPGTPADWIADSSLSSPELAGFLLDASPLGNAEIDAAIARNPAMDGLDLFGVLQANAPLTGGQINGLVQNPTPLNGDQITEVLLAHSLSNGNLNQIVDSLFLSDANLRDTLIANSPLGNGVLNGLGNRTPPLNPTDYDLVMAAQ